MCRSAYSLFFLYVCAEKGTDSFFIRRFSVEVGGMFRPVSDDTYFVRNSKAINVCRVGCCLNEIIILSEASSAFIERKKRVAGR